MHAQLLTLGITLGYLHMVEHVVVLELAPVECPIALNWINKVHLDLQSDQDEVSVVAVTSTSLLFKATIRNLIEWLMYETNRSWRKIQIWICVGWWGWRQSMLDSLALALTLCKATLDWSRQYWWDMFPLWRRWKLILRILPKRMHTQLQCYLHLVKVSCCGVAPLVAVVVISDTIGSAIPSVIRE